MNKQLKRIAPLLVLVLIVTACAGASPQRVALNSLQGVRESVVAAVGVFNVGYQAGQYNDAQREQLGVLYGKYLMADKLAAESLLATTGGDPQTVVNQVTLVALDVLKFVQALKCPGGVPCS